MFPHNKQHTMSRNKTKNSKHTNKKNVYSLKRIQRPTLLRNCGIVFCLLFSCKHKLLRRCWCCLYDLLILFRCGSPARVCSI